MGERARLSRWKVGVRAIRSYRLVDPYPRWWFFPAFEPHRTEVEAGPTMGNAIYRDLIQGSLVKAG